MVETADRCLMLTRLLMALSLAL